MSPRRQGDALRAGIFLVIGVLVFTAAIFLLGQKSALFTRTTTLFVSFDDISGLTVGAPVRLAGLEVGTVAGLSFPVDLSHKETRVRLLVQSKYMSRIRADSQAFIDSAGLLGDKIVNISMGDPKAGELQDGATLEAGQAISFEALSANIDKVLRSVASITQSVDAIVQDGRTERVQQDFSRITGSLANILGEVEQGPGLAHRLIYDPQYAEQAAAILQETRAFAANAHHAVERVDAVMTEVERGKGTLHDLVYGENGKQALSELSSAAGEINAVVREVREGHGVLHTLVYEEGHANFLDELNAMSAALNRVAQDIDKGRGTLGGLARDPTVYEDLKTVLGNVKRNVLFKALIRYTMEKDGLRRTENAPRVSEGAAETGPSKLAAPQPTTRAVSQGK